MGSSRAPLGSGTGSAAASRSRETSPWGDARAAPYAETAWVELGVVPGGYGWVFPKGDHANLGVGGWMAEGPQLRVHLTRLAHVHGVEPSSLRDVRAIGFRCAGRHARG